MEINVFNKSFEWLKVVDTFASCIWTDRYNEAGEFELYTPVDEEYFTALAYGNYLTREGSEHEMIVEGMEIVNDAEEGKELKFTGRSLESILERRIIWGQKTYTGKLQTVIHNMLNDAIISPADESRKIDNFIFEECTDSRLDSISVEVQYTGDNLYTAVTKLLGQYGVGFKVTRNSSNQFVFALYVGADRSYDQMANPFVVFSPNFENIINSNYAESIKNYANVAWIAGEGDGAARKTATYGSTTGLERREIYTDARDLSQDTDDGTLTDTEYTAQLKARGQTDLGDHTITRAFDGEVDTQSMFVYGTDFFLGDVVQIEDEFGLSGTSRISEIVTSEAADGYTVVPTFKSTEEAEEE